MSISARREVKVHKTFLLKVVFFFLFSFFHLVLLFVFLYSISDWFTLIHFLLFLSPSLTSISFTHSPAWTCERALILHVYILLWNELIVPFVSHFTKSPRIVHELHKFKLFIYFVVEFSVSCIVSSLVDATSPKPYQQANVIVIAQFASVWIIAAKCAFSENCFCTGKIYVGRLIRYVLKPVTHPAPRECIISYSLIFRDYHQCFFQIDILIRILYQCFRYLEHCNIVVHASDNNLLSYSLFIFWGNSPFLQEYCTYDLQTLISSRLL